MTACEPELKQKYDRLTETEKSENKFKSNRNVNASLRSFFFCLKSISGMLWKNKCVRLSPNV